MLASAGSLLWLPLLLHAAGCGWERDNPMDGKGIHPPPPDQMLPRDQGVPGTWVSIPAGTYLMGSPAGEPCRADNEKQHQVTLSQKLEMQSTEVTQGQFLSAMGYNPSAHASCGLTCPVDSLSWHEAAAYCNALSARAGKTACYACSGSGVGVSCQEAARFKGEIIYSCPGYRLPTEAEWEYAYRAGITTAFYNGPNDGTKCDTTSNKDTNADLIAWYIANSGLKPHPVGEKRPNGWGLFDMAGNLWEWCHDPYQEDLGYAAVKDPLGSGSGNRVDRGGAWDNSADDQRAARRGSYSPSSPYSQLGFRCVRGAISP